MAVGGRTHQKKLTLRRTYSFVIEKHIEDVKQGQQFDPGLVEPITRHTRLVTEELRRMLLKINEISFKTKEKRV